jgi:uncharacterized membrane protein
MQIITKILLPAFALLFFTQAAFAHDPQEHKKEEKNEAAVDSTAHVAGEAADTMLHAAHEEAPGGGGEASLEDFPNYHPLIVHFPIVLLLLAVAMQFFGFFIKSQGYHRTIFVLAALGYASAWFAAAWRHPHIDPDIVSAAIKHIFDDHQLYAKWAVWLGGAAAFAKGLELFFKRRWFLVALTTVLLAAAAASVAISGHHGAELVHKHGVGTQGKYLEVHEHEH